MGGRPPPPRLSCLALAAPPFSLCHRQAASLHDFLAAKGMNTQPFGSGSTSFAIKTISRRGGCRPLPPPDKGGFVTAVVPAVSSSVQPGFCGDEGSPIPMGRTMIHPHSSLSFVAWLDTGQLHALHFQPLVWAFSLIKDEISPVSTICARCFTVAGSIFVFFFSAILAFVFQRFLLW